MSEPLLLYLRQRQGPVHAAELAAEALKLQNVPAGVAARLIDSLLAGEERVDRVAEDTYLYRGAPEALLVARGWLLCSALPERASRWQEWQALGCVRWCAGRVEAIATITAAEEPDWPGRIARFLRRLQAEALDEALLFSGFGNQASLLRRAAADLLEHPLSNPLLALRPLAVRLWPEARLTGPEELAARLGLPAWSGAEIAPALEQLAAIWAGLVELLAARGIVTPGQLAEFMASAEAALDWSPYDFDADFIASLPETPGVYLMRDREETVIYVGKAANLARRVKSYFAAGAEVDAKLEQIRRRLFRLEIREVGSELAALLLEQRFIRRFDPAINRQIQVQERPHRQRARFPRILVLPAAVPEWLQLFFLHPERGLASFWLARDYAQPGVLPPCCAAWQESNSTGVSGEGDLLRNKRALMAAVRRFYWEGSGSGDPDAAELAWSWLGSQAAPVPGIDLRRIAAPAEAVRLLEEYRLRLTDWDDRVIFT
ncbi:MAG TPA: nucleotide excision repair endonuclease [bacterium]|nr:nucleotide excision repair endonuclease [bacterium]